MAGIMWRTDRSVTLHRDGLSQECAMSRAMQTSAPGNVIFLNFSVNSSSAYA